MAPPRSKKTFGGAVAGFLQKVEFEILLLLVTLLVLYTITSMVSMNH